MTVTTRRERRQQQRRQQQRRATGGGSRRSGGVWIAVIAIVVAFAVILGARAAGILDAPGASGGIDVGSVDAGGQTLGVHRQDLGNGHVATGQRVNYPSLPPTSGEHWGSPAAPAPWGIKTTTLQFEVTTHNLEHGGIVILYAADLPGTEVDQIRSLVRQLQSAGTNKIVLEPWSEMPKDSKIILTAWNWILKLPTFDQAAFVKFVRQHHAAAEAPEATVP